MMRILLVALVFQAVSPLGSTAANPTPTRDAPDGILLVGSSDAAKIPPKVTSAAREYVDECKSYGASPIPSSRFVSTVDLNADSYPDYIIDTAELNASCFCGSGGCTIEAWVSDRGAYTKAFESNVRGWRLSPRDDLPPVLIVDLHGTACGGVGADLCLKALVYRNGKLIDTTAGQ